MKTEKTKTNTPKAETGHPRQHSARIIPAVTLTEGAGVTVQRTIGAPALRNLDPFMLLDFFCSDQPDEYIAGFPSHPHRGFNTFTYMLDGHIEHKDSMGNTGRLSPGSAQWMKAASGVIHSEMPKQENGLMRGFQLWINLPAARKMDAPQYQEYSAGDFPQIDTAEYRVKLIVGEYEGQRSPIQDELTRVSYLDVRIQPGKTFTTTLLPGRQHFIYLFEGNAQYAGQPAPANTLIVPDTDLITQAETVRLTAAESGARLLLVSGEPLHEPVVQYGPFVMSTREEIDQAVKDFQSNNFVRERAWINRTTSTTSNKR